MPGSLAFVPQATSELPLRVTDVWPLPFTCAPLPIPLLHGSGEVLSVRPYAETQHMKAAVLTQQRKRQEDFKFLFSLESLFVAFVLYILLEYLKQGHAFTTPFPPP